MTDSTLQWEHLYRQVPLCDVPRHFASIRQSPFTLDYLSTVLRHCPRGGRSYETGVGSGYGAIWLSLRGVQAQGIDLSPALVERAQHINSLLGGAATFATGDLFELYDRGERAERERYSVIHHQGVLEHFSKPLIHAALAQQVACADFVVFSVPSVFYPFEPEFGDERLLPLDEWRRLLEPFDVVELRYHGDPQHGEREHVLAVLRGEAVTKDLLALMSVPKQPFPHGISAIVHTRNEERHIGDCLTTLAGWTDEIIVCDMESEDKTIDIARSMGAQIVEHPRITNFDRSRNVSAMRAGFSWVFYLDADERVPPALGEALRRLVDGWANESANELVSGGSAGCDAMLIPFRHHFCGKWMECLYPGYTAPRLLKNGRFVFNARLHSGAQVEGPIMRFPADDPNLALVHYSFDNLSHYLTKLNRYTDGEAANMHRDGHRFHWHNAVRHFMVDFQSYYAAGATRDGVHGFLYAFLSGFYRFEQHAKLFEHRFHSGQLTPAETAVPQSLEEMLEFALHVVRERPLPPPTALVVSPSPQGLTTDREAAKEEDYKEQAAAAQVIETEDGKGKNETHGDVRSITIEDQSPQLPVSTEQNAAIGSRTSQGASTQWSPAPLKKVKREIVWSGPLLDPSGYGEECRHFLLGLDSIGYPASAQVVPWSHDQVDMAPQERERLAQLCARPVAPGFIHISQNLGPGLRCHPQAGMNIGRTMFETDRLPREWVQACNRLDRVWVPSEFNRYTFAGSGVVRDKLAVIPGALDSDHFRRAGACLEKAPLGSSSGSNEALGAVLRELPDSDRMVLEELRAEAAVSSAFVFLSVFDWSLHKGWDTLLGGFLRAFECQNDVRLWLKVWSTNGYDQSHIQDQAARWALEELGHDLGRDVRVRFIPQRLSRGGLEMLYLLADGFVLPSRGEGWGRPYMEAMALGKPVIGTGWSGNTAFMTKENSFLLDFKLCDVPEKGWTEIPAYRGHRWAEPDATQLETMLRHVKTDPERVRDVSARARQEILERFDRRVVARQIEDEIERLAQEVTATPRSSVSPESFLSSASSVASAVSSPTPKPDHRIEQATQPPDSLSEALSLEEPVRVRWEGAQFSWHSLGQVNREISLALIGGPHWSAKQSSGGKIGLVDEGSADSASARMLCGPTDGQSHVRIRNDALELSLLPTEPNEFTPEVDPRFGALASRMFAPLTGPVDVHVRHFFPPRFERPAQGQLVLIQPWEYGFLPEAWIEPVKRHVDEVWCYSEFVRQVYIDSGIAPEKLNVVPLGVDTEVFRPEAPSYVFTSEPGAAALRGRSNATGHGGPTANSASGQGQEPREPARCGPFVFLFVGGTLHRKGIDILLKAYQRAFTALDEVCLVIKDTGTQTVYRVGNDRENILGLISEGRGAPLIYIDEDLSSHELAGLYTACDCVVLPYRGEGFCLPALEAMACGKPVVVPEGGPTDDFVDESVGWRLPSRREPFGVLRSGRGRIGDWECVGPTWLLEIDPDDLARQMRRIAGDREEAKRRGQAGALRAQNWTWRNTATIVQERLREVRQGAVPATPSPSSPAFPLSNTRPSGAKAVSTASDAALATSARATSAPARNSLRSSPTISLCMIVRDEERVLGECLQSAKSWFDEIIVVDTGSTDRTVEIARGHGAKVSHFLWCDDFSAARNVSLQEATGEWIFWMDADDTLPEECGRQLRRLVELAEERVTGFIAQVHIPAAPGETGFTIVDHVKLFRNRPNLRFEGRIHEQILGAIHQAGGAIERSEVYVVHSGYDHSPQGQEKKRERDLTILKKDLADRPGHPFVLFNIGMTAYHMKDFERAVPALEECLRRAAPRESIVRKVYAMLAGSCLEGRDLPRSRDWIEQGLELFPRDPELLFRAGIIYREVGELEQAERCYLTLLTAREVGHIDSIDVTMTGFKAHHNLGLIYQQMGRWEQAAAQFEQAVRDNPQFHPSQLGLAESYRRVGRAEEARHIETRLSSSGVK